MEEKKERKSWRDIVSSRNPDLDLEDDLAVGEFLDDSFKRYDDSESQRENLNKVLAEDSRAAGILTGLASGMDENGEPFSLVEYLITNYGDDIREAATTEEAIKKAKVWDLLQVRVSDRLQARLCRAFTVLMKYVQCQYTDRLLVLISRRLLIYQKR